MRKTRESVERSEKSTENRLVQYVRRRYLYISFCAVLMVALEWSLLAHGVDNPIYLLALLFWLCVVGYSYYDHDPVPREFMRRFAKENEFTYLPIGDIRDYTGFLFKIGQEKSVTNVVQGVYKNLPLALLNYSYVTGPEKFQEEHNYTIFALRIGEKIPDLLLENVKDNFGEPLLETISRKGLIKLEGDFNKYFSLSVSRGYEVEALEIFAPDIMADLIQSGKSLSLEMSDGQLFIYMGKIAETKNDFRDIYKLADYFAQKLIPVLARMKYVSSPLPTS